MPASQHRPPGICSQCDRPCDIVNVVLKLCGACNRTRLRTIEREERGPSPTHELSGHARNAINKQRRAYHAFLHAMEQLDFSFEEKRQCQLVARPHIWLLDGDHLPNPGGLHSDDEDGEPVTIDITKQ
jgi:hypothetical protein